MLGITPESLPDQTPKMFEVWPENQTAVEMFLRVSTQWRTAFSGVVGLDYNVLFQLFGLYAIVDQKQLFEDLRVMERAVLSSLSKAEAT